MAFPRSLAAYTECEDHFAQADASENGIRLRFATPGLAVRYRQKLNTFRVRLREHSETLYANSDPRHGTSAYDHLTVSIDPDDDSALIIRKNVITPDSVEEL